MSARGGGRARWTRLHRSPAVRAGLYQVLLLALLGWLAYELVANARANLQAQRIANGFGFLANNAGFAINQSLIPYDESASYARVFLVGILNTILVAALGIVFATILGFLVGIARLSPNWLVSRLAGAYVEVIRNLPLLFQILFWYLAVLGSLPGPRQSLSLPGHVFLNNRGIVVPRPEFGEATLAVLAAVAFGIAAAVVHRLRARRRRARGEAVPSIWISLAILVAPPLAALAWVGSPVSFDRPELRGFNFVGGARLTPEFAALLVALSTYTAGFIAEIVRAGLLAVPRGQTEAAAALGLRPGMTLRLVVVPLALRVIIPPLTSQYLNLTKNSSLAYAIGYPDLVAVFAGTTLNQTGQAIEIIAMTMAVYLVLSLITSLFMNWYNARVALVER